MMANVRVSVGALLVLVIASISVGASDSSPVLDSQVFDKLRADLPDVLAGAGPEELIPVTIVMTEQVPRDEVAAAKQILDLGQRRRAVIEMLRERATQSQRELLVELRRLQVGGAVGPRLHSLWIHNLVAAEVTAETAYAIAARDDVAYLNYDRPVGVEVMPFEPGEPPASSEIECGVAQMQTPRVWDELGITGEGVIVGLIDTGACITHPDLADHLWNNPGEIADNGIDDDDNGHIDDIHRVELPR